MWHMHSGWGWWMVFGWIWTIAFWVILIWGVQALVRGGRRRPEPPPAEPSPLEILERRYARGELSDEQFEQMRDRLRGPAGGEPRPSEPPTGGVS